MPSRERVFLAMKLVLMRARFRRPDLQPRMTISIRFSRLVRAVLRA